jgi:hypothetical protein
VQRGKARKVQLAPTAGTMKEEKDPQNAILLDGRSAGGA